MPATLINDGSFFKDERLMFPTILRLVGARIKLGSRVMVALLRQRFNVR